MFEGIYFQFPKLAFLLFVYLGCEALCRVRTAPLYFPHIRSFGMVGVNPPLWHWISKWAMITMLIIALMSPVKEHHESSEGGSYDIVLAIDPSALSPELVRQIETFIDHRSTERIGVWSPDISETIIPLTREHEALKSMIRQLSQGKRHAQVSRNVGRFFADSGEKIRWIVILSENPKSFVHALPVGVVHSVGSVGSDWLEEVERSYPELPVAPGIPTFDFYYVYPLFLGFLSMLVYLYGRNQKGLK